MKKLVLILFSLSLFSSCSTDEINHDEELIGVWEQKGFSDDSGFRLVFASDRTGIKIYREVSDNDNVISTSSSFNWEKSDSNVTISDESDLIIDTFIINHEGQLISNNIENLPYDKISNTTLNYY